MPHHGPGRAGPKPPDEPGDTERWVLDVAADEPFEPVAIRCAWCHGWMAAPTWPERLPVSHGLCPPCRDHLSQLAAPI